MVEDDVAQQIAEFAGIQVFSILIENNIVGDVVIAKNSSQITITFSFVGKVPVSIVADVSYYTLEDCMVILFEELDIPYSDNNWVISLMRAGYNLYQHV